MNDMTGASPPPEEAGNVSSKEVSRCVCLPYADMLNACRCGMSQDIRIEDGGMRCGVGRTQFFFLQQNEQHTRHDKHAYKGDNTAKGNGVPSWTCGC